MSYCCCSVSQVFSPKEPHEILVLKLFSSEGWTVHSLWRLPHYNNTLCPIIAIFGHVVYPLLIAIKNKEASKSQDSNRPLFLDCVETPSRMMGEASISYCMVWRLIGRLHAVACVCMYAGDLLGIVYISMHLIISFCILGCGSMRRSHVLVDESITPCTVCAVLSFTSIGSRY